MRYPPTRHALPARPGEGVPSISPFLPGLTKGPPLRLRAEGRNNFKFDESRAGIDEGSCCPGSGGA